MTNTETKIYGTLNGIADKNGIVIMGGSEDKDIPLCELRQAFEIEAKIYNRSTDKLSVNNAVGIYDACVACLEPETLLLHIGNADTEDFKTSPAEFDQKYRELLCHIKENAPKCRIAVISLKNYDNDPDIAQLNKHLEYIAESERCEFGDIAGKRLWNPIETKDVVSFVYSTGFVHPLKNKRPVYDLIKILFCCE